MIDPLVAAFWAQTLTVEERVVRAIDTICMERVSRGAALRAHHLGSKAFYRCIREWGIEDWIPMWRTPRQPYTRTANIKERPNPKWPLQDAKGMLWRGASEAAVAEALGISEQVLRDTLEREARWCRKHGFCPWCEILLAHAEGREGEMCSECAEVLRGKPVLLREDKEKA